MATQGQFSHTLQPQQHVCRAERRGGRRFGLAHERFGRAIVSEAVGCRRGRHCTKRPRETATKRSKNGRETVVKISIQLCLSQACLGSSLRFSRKEEACRGKIKRGQQVCVLCVCVLCFVFCDFGYLTCNPRGTEGVCDARDKLLRAWCAQR